MSTALRIGAAAFSFVSFVAASPVKLVPYRATYDVSLASTQTNAVVTVRGRTVIEFRDQCSTWATTQRFIADMTDGDGNVSRTDYIVIAKERKDAKGMDFNITTIADGATVKRQIGKAILGASPLVTLESEKEKAVTLPPGTIPPTEHTREIVDAAQRGETVLKRTVFQGGDERDIYVALATIGIYGKPDNDVADAANLLSGRKPYSVAIGYYPVLGDSELPDYQVSASIYPNGISGTMTLIYKRFSLKAKLAKLGPLPSTCR